MTAMPSSKKLLVQPPIIMGILNITPDSFSDGGLFMDEEKALAHAQRMVSEGADIIDVGGESTRPGAHKVSAPEQINRVRKTIKLLSQQLPKKIRLSIDTSEKAVAEVALDAGACLLNDISAGRADRDMLPLAKARRASVILMHMQGNPENMQQAPCYQDVVSDVCAFLRERADYARSLGIPEGHIILDPGIGFGKTKAHNLALIRHLDQIVSLGYPVLIGTSRKRFMGKICQEDTPDNLLGATAATTALAVANGVSLFRVHDVRVNRQAADVAYALYHGNA